MSPIRGKVRSQGSRGIQQAGPLGHGTQAAPCPLFVVWFTREKRNLTGRSLRTWNTSCARSRQWRGNARMGVEEFCTRGSSDPSGDEHLLYQVPCSVRVHRGVGKFNRQILQDRNTSCARSHEPHGSRGTLKADT